MAVSDYQLAIVKAINEDWDLVKDTAGAVNNAAEIFPLAYRFGWHAARKHEGYVDVDERIRQLEKQCEVLAAEIDRQRPIVEAAIELVKYSVTKTCNQAYAGELAILEKVTREYEASKPK